MYIGKSQKYQEFTNHSSVIALFLLVLIINTGRADQNAVCNRVSLDSLNQIEQLWTDSSWAPMFEPGQAMGLGFDNNCFPSLSPGVRVATTTFDTQHNGSMRRQVDWRGSQNVHFAWTHKINVAQDNRQHTHYQAWDATVAAFIYPWTDDSGGCQISSQLEYRHNYPTIDVTPDGRAVIANGVDSIPAIGYKPYVWYDYVPGICFFSATNSTPPDSTMRFYFDPDSEYEYMWPSMEYQIYNNDTVVHLFAMQKKTANRPGYIVYFRKYGDSAPGIWSYPPMIIDTAKVMAHTVTASRVSSKVALVWLAGYPVIPGSGESFTDRDERVNDVFYLVSNDMGLTWGQKNNITKFDPSKPNWLANTDLSALIDTQDHLHIIWNAREYSPAAGGCYPHFWGCRLFHWDEYNNLISTIKDANWDIPSDGCTGGKWNEMSIVKMQISECDGKLYALFVQFNDVRNGITDDCHISNWSGNHYGTANGELFIAVSNNSGMNWDVARNLTNTYTPKCNLDGPLCCEPEMWPSMSRFGMDAAGGDWTGVPVVDPSGGYTGNWYLDAFYVDDRYPGSSLYDTRVWTFNPMRWFRVPCVVPIVNPLLTIVPDKIDYPAWTKPGVELDSVIRLGNIGNVTLHVVAANVYRITGSEDWLGITGIPANIPYMAPNYHDVHLKLNKGGVVTTGPRDYEGFIEFMSDAPTSPDTLFIHLMIIDTLSSSDTLTFQPAQWVGVKAACTRLTVSNSGNLGYQSDQGNGGQNLGFINDCDTTNNIVGADDNAKVYLHDASPFLMRITPSGDTLLDCSVFDAIWANENGFIPQASLTADSSRMDYQHIYTGRYVSHDSAIGIESDYWLPLHPDTCGIVIQKMKIVNLSGTNIDNLMVGELMDWDIPSDTGVENGSGFDAGRKTMYCYGAEYAPDSIYPNNDCVTADSRVGGYSYITGYRLPYTGSSCRFDDITGAFTGMKADWINPTGNFLPGQLWQKLSALTGYERWQSTNPGMEDSLYQDLVMVSNFRRCQLATSDTLVFLSILATEYDGGLVGFRTRIDKARAWIEGHLPCCIKPGDANNNGNVNIQDITFLINYLYKGGPKPPCFAEGNSNGSGLPCPSINIQDVTYLIKFLYQSGPAPKCGPDCAD